MKNFLKFSLSALLITAGAANLFAAGCPTSVPFGNSLLGSYGLQAQYGTLGTDSTSFYWLQGTPATNSGTCAISTWLLDDGAGGYYNGSDWGNACNTACTATPLPPAITSVTTGVINVRAGETTAGHAGQYLLHSVHYSRSEERRVGKECRL